MQNKEELRQKGHDRRQKTTCRERGKKYHFPKGGGGVINIVFGPKYRPLRERIINSRPATDNQVRDGEKGLKKATAN